MVSYYVTKMITMCWPIIGQFYDTMIVAWTYKEWLKWPIKVLESAVACCLSNLEQSDLYEISKTAFKFTVFIHLSAFKLIST